MPKPITYSAQGNDTSYSSLIKAGAVYLSTTTSYASLSLLFGFGNWLKGANAATPSPIFCSIYRVTEATHQ